MVIPTIDKEQTLTPNNLQFQPGLSLSEFLRDYGTQAQCEAALEKTRRPAGYLLPSVSERQPRHRLAWQGQDLPVQPLPYPSYPNRRDDLSRDQIVPGQVVPGYVLSYPDEKQRLRPGTEASHRSLLSHGLEGQAQVAPGHARTRREHGPERPGRS